MDRLERLVNLVAALIETPRPLTRAEIRKRTPGYSDDDDAFRRNFERDKELLRRMGLPLVTTAPDPAHPEDVGYRIPRELYELPDPGLDEDELAALRLAASAVQVDADWGREAVTRAMRKLGAGGGDPEHPDAGLAALPGQEAAASAFAAVIDRRQVGFSYRGAVRLVDPWRLSFHRGHWYLSGFDHTRGEERLYRLDRIEGELSAQGEPGAFSRPQLAQALPPPAWRLGEDDEMVAILRVDAEQAHWARAELGDDTVRSTSQDGSVEFEVAVTNAAAFRSVVLGYLDHAEILAPPALRASTIEWLEAIAGEGAA